MSLQLDAIKLNHDPSGATTDALNIRRNHGTFVTVPEWTRGVSTVPEGIGEVAFAGAGDRALVLALANLVLVVRTAGGKPAPVTDVAETLERDLRNPREPGGRVAPEIETLEAGPPRADGTVQISLEAADPLGRPVWFQLLGRGGELLVRNRELAFRPYGPGPRELTVYAINENKGSSSRRLTLAD